MRGRSIVLVRALLLGTLVAAGTACEEAPESAGTAQIPVGPDTLPPPDQVVEDGEHVMTVDGVKKAILVAEQLYFYNDTSTVIGDTIEVSFFGDAGEPVSMLTARSGVINQRSQEMTARGNVDVRSRDSRIETEVLHYEPDADRIWSDQPTIIHQEGNVIRGQGVESDPALERINIRGGSAVLRSEPELGPRSREEAEENEEDAPRPNRDEPPPDAGNEEEDAGEATPEETPEEAAPREAEQPAVEEPARDTPAGGEGDPDEGA